VSGLDELTREELIALVIKQHETIEAQAKRIAELEAVVQSQAERISVLEEEISKLSGPKSKPSFVKANAPKKEKGPRKKRTQSFARKSRVATEVICHAVECCPDCGRKLIGGTVKSKHQVIDVPAAPVTVTDHLFIERYCGVCGKRFTPDASEWWSTRFGKWLNQICSRRSRLSSCTCRHRPSQSRSSHVEKQSYRN
jgi:hypothetical protein